MPAPDLGVQLGSLTLKNPIVCGSGEHVYPHRIMGYGLQAFAVAQ